ncbi:ABC transporter substrate-binding protein [Hominifimenecus sp. rT4P-3]|uniref:ABC transporter substrate-binding protein n=1 Tax=Hominifimenecus sp. rT4P-3 TaxID=3242979 RepID=UPI003DA560A7
MKKFKKCLCFMMSTAMAVTMLTACGGGQTADTTAAANGGGEPGNAATEAQQQPSGAEKESCVKVSVSETPNLDPAVATSNSENIAMVNIYDSLVYPDSSVESGVVGRIADSWEASADGLTYTFKLKQGIKFHNGDELTAADVVYSMDRFLTIGEGNSYVFEGYIEPGNTEATDDYTVVFHLSQPFGPFANALVRLYILNSKQVEANEDKSVTTYGDHGDYGKAWLISNDAGSGAYMVKTLVQQDYLYAEKFDDWFVGWKSDIAPEAFKLLAVSEATTIRTMMNSRELDITDTWQSTETLDALSKIDGVSIATYSNTLSYHMYYNNQAAPLDDINVRRALNCLVDYETICNNILLDSTPLEGLAPASMAGYAKTSTFTYDVEKAKEYLAASKYADNYQDYPIEIVVNSDVADLEKIALLLQASAQQVGIKIEISKAPWVSLIDKMGSVETSPQITMINFGSPVGDVGTLIQSRYSKTTQGTWNNGEWLDDEKMEADLKDALLTVDDAERNQKYAALQNYIVDELCPSCFLCSLAERCAYQSGYLTWSFIEDTPAGEVATAANGYTVIFSDMEYHLDKK